MISVTVKAFRLFRSGETISKASHSELFNSLMTLPTVTRSLPSCSHLKMSEARQVELFITNVFMTHGRSVSHGNNVKKIVDGSQSAPVIFHMSLILVGALNLCIEIRK